MPLAELLGQDLARERLLDMAVRVRVPQTLLFSGPQGVGKELAATLFAQALSCRAQSSGDACGRCPSCIQVRRRIYPDMLIIEAENKQIKIEQVGEIQDFISFAPLVGERRIVIIKDAHKLNPTAANALLKTLEEPSPAVLFILLSHRHNLLLATILSRCLMLPFVALSAVAVAAVLRRQELAEEYGNLDDVRLAEAAAWSGGSMGRAHFFLLEDNLVWCREFIRKFSRLPEMTLFSALDLAESAAGFPEREVVFFILRSFLHDAVLLARNLTEYKSGMLQSSSLDWSESVKSFAALKEQRILSIRRQIVEIEQAQGVNVNIKLAFEALFTAIVADVKLK